MPFSHICRKGGKESRRGGNGGQSIQRVYTKTMRDAKKRKDKEGVSGNFDVEWDGRWGNSKATSSIITSKTVRAD